MCLFHAKSKHLFLISKVIDKDPLPEIVKEWKTHAGRNHTNWKHMESDLFTKSASCPTFDSKKSKNIGRAKDDLRNDESIILKAMCTSGYMGEENTKKPFKSLQLFGNACPDCLLVFSHIFNSNQGRIAGLINNGI